MDSDGSITCFSDISQGDSFPFHDSGNIGRQPEKIIITLTASNVFGYPLMLISHRLAVLRFRRSICDIFSESDGLWRNLSIPAFVGITFPSGILFTKDVIVATYQKDGIFGFFRGFPETVLHHLFRDILNYVIPVYLSPKIVAIKDTCTSITSFFDSFSVNFLRNHWSDRIFTNSVISSENKLIRGYLGFYNRNFKVYESDLVSKILVELLSYPLLTLSSRSAIYDGTEQMNFFQLLKSTIKIDGIKSLYNGFIPHILSMLCIHLDKQIRKRERSIFIEEYRRKSIVSRETFLVIITIVNALLQQISLVRRCASQMDGLCMDESTYSILATIPWINVITQLLLTVSLLHFKETILEG